MRRNKQPARVSLSIAVLSATAAMIGCDGGSGSSNGTLAMGAGAGGSGDPMMSTYTVTATVTGLTGHGLVLELNGSQDQLVATDGTVTFPSGLMTDAAYAITVKTQPTTQREICGVSNGSGTIGQANVANVAVNCSIVLGFLYQTVDTASQTQASYQLLSYGITQGTGALVPFGTSFATDSRLPGGQMVVAPGGGFLILTSDINETDGGLSVYAVNSDTGALTAASSIVTTGFLPGWIVMSPQGFLFMLGTGAPNFPPGTPGFKSVLVTYLFDASAGTLTPTGTPLMLSGTSFAVTPDGKFLYVLNVDFGSNTPAPTTLTAYAIDAATGALTAGPVLTWTPTSGNNNTSPSTMAMDTQGRFLYLASEQGDTIQAAATVVPYAVDPASGALTPIGTGTPIASDAGGMAFDPSGRYLYVLNSLNSNVANETVLAMAIDQSSGVVSQLGSPLETDAPVTIMCDPSGQFVYVGTGGSTFFYPTAPDLASFAVSTSSSTAGQLVANGQSGPTAATIALAIVE